MDISGILGQIRSGGFVNPFSAPINAALGNLSIPSVLDMTTLATAQSLASGLPMPSNSLIVAAQASLTNGYNAIQNLLDHTNRISGVDLSGTNTLGTIAKTMQSARNITGEASCSSVLGAFGSIMDAANLISASVFAIQNIQQFLQNIPGLINSIPTLIDTYANRIAQQIAADVAALAQGQLQVLENAIASSLVSLFNDECTSQVLSAVMTQPLKNEVSSAATKFAQNKIKSITGK